MNCAACHSPVISYYTVTRVVQNAVPPGPVTLCSLVCLIKWAYNETAIQGIALAVGARNAFDQLMTMLRGGR